MLRVILSRAARSARRAAHFDLEAPGEPQTGEYWCHKHRRMCRPVESAVGFLRRYTLDTLTRIETFADAARRRTRGARAPRRLAHGRATRTTFDGVLTSPPYPGLIDYHEQHRYAYELLGLDDRRELELGAAEDGNVAGGDRGVPRPGSRPRSRTPRRRCGRARRCSSSSTTAATSTRRSSTAPGSGSRRGCAGT